MNIIHEITMDFCVPGLVPRIHAVQGDSLTRQVAVTLLSDGRDWTIPAGTGAAIRYRKPDGTGGSYDSLPDGSCAWAAAENVITFALAPQMLTVPGCVEAQAVLVSGTDILATFSFQLIVTRDPSLDAIESEDYFNWLQWTQAQMDLYVEKMMAEGTFTGATPNLTIGTVTTLPAGSNATASITGTAEDPVLNLGLPSGSADGALMLGGGTMQGPIAMGGNKITGLGTPTASTDAVTKAYADSLKGDCVLTDDGSGHLYRTVDGVTEWVNPPMILGTEYRTIERHQGKAVYTKAVNCGSLPANSYKVLSHGAAAAHVLRYAGYRSNGDALPFMHYMADGGDIYIDILVGNSVIYITTNDAGAGSHTATVQLWYTKD